MNFSPHYHSTMIRRTTVSAPMRQLLSEGRILGRSVDYGCGVDPHGLPGYDPMVPGRTYHPATWPDPGNEPLFDTVTCIYVLNIVDAPTAEELVIDIESLLTRTGTAYFAVRSDLKESTATQFYRSPSWYSDLFHTHFRTVQREPHGHFTLWACSISTSPLNGAI